MFDDDFPGGIQATEGTSFDDVPWIVGFSRIDREGFII